MVAVTAPTSTQLEMFHATLWKEQRVLEMISGAGITPALRKHFRSVAEADAELHYLSLVNGREPGLAPTVLGASGNTIDLEYVEGTRVFNVLTLLKALEPADRRAREIRVRLIERCALSCARIQDALVTDMPSSSRARPYYPLRAKLITLLGLFDHCLHLGLDLTKIQAEVACAEQHLRAISCAVPFRDGAPKNLILRLPQMWLGRVSVAEQREIVRDIVARWSPSDGGAIEAARIVHVDFSSCTELTVPEDDPISLWMHESSWLDDLPTVDRLLWQPLEHDATRLSIGLVVRMYRLGGRRLSYRLLHCDGYYARYADESLEFYFRTLTLASKTICPQLTTLFPEILMATDAILARLQEGIRTERDWFRELYRPVMSRYYRDVFPF
jgi:hypothetical protein